MKTKEAIKVFINSRQSRGLSKETIRWYRGILNKLIQQYPVLPRSPTRIEAFLGNCEAGDERRHGYYRALRCFYRFLRKRYRLPNPIEMIDAPRRKSKQKNILMPEAINQLLAYKHKADIKAALLFLIDTGARVCELSSLSIDSLSETPWGYTALISGKTGERTVPINYETYHALMINLPFPKSRYWIRRKISRAFKDAKVDGSAINLRHTFATLWEGDELVLQNIMGHASLSTTKIYRQTRIKRLLEQHSKYSPLKMVLYNSKSML